MSTAGLGGTVAPFERWTARYDAWFTGHVHAFLSELQALGEVIGRPERPVEIGVGTGRFADPLGVRLGIDPAHAPCQRARKRGIDVVRGVGEALPLGDHTVDLVLVMTTLCFIDDIDQAFDEIVRVLEPGGAVVVGLIDRESPLGEAYERRRSQNPFYESAQFYAAQEVVDRLRAHGFQIERTRQTLFLDPEDLEAPDRVEEGRGEGGFVALRGRHGT